MIKYQDLWPYSVPPPKKVVFMHPYFISTFHPVTSVCSSPKAPSVCLLADCYSDIYPAQRGTKKTKKQSLTPFTYSLRMSSAQKSVSVWSCWIWLNYRKRFNYFRYGGFVFICVALSFCLFVTTFGYIRLDIMRARHAPRFFSHRLWPRIHTLAIE